MYNVLPAGVRSEAEYGRGERSDGQTRRDQHLMSAPTNEPQAGVVRETVFDSASYLGGLTLRVERPEDEVRKSVALFLAGGPLSGKTSVLKSLRDAGHTLIPTDAVLVDPKLIREQLPEWPALLEAREPDAAERVYEECCDVARQLTAEAVKLRRDVIIDGVGASGERQFSALLEVFDALGYEVRVLLVDTPTEAAERRNLARAKAEGLLIDGAQLASLHREVSARFNEWKDLPTVFEMYATE
jgi:predicted kinase